MTQPPEGASANPPPFGQYPPYQSPPSYQPQPSAPPYDQQWTTPPTQGKTSGFAIASLVFGIFGGVLLSVIFGAIALSKTKDGSQRGRGMAIAGLVLSGVWIVIIAIAVIAEMLSPTQSESASDIKVGDCLATVPTGSTVSSVDTIGCNQPHSAEVVAVLTMPDGSFPDRSVFTDYKKKCAGALTTYSATADQDANVDLVVLPPSQGSWQRGDREMDCLATFKTQRTGSIKG